MSLLFNMLSRVVITFLPRSKHLLISWLQSPSAVILEREFSSAIKKEDIKKIKEIRKNYKKIQIMFSNMFYIKVKKILKKNIARKIKIFVHIGEKKI